MLLVIRARQRWLGSTPLCWKSSACFPLGGNTVVETSGAKLASGGLPDLLNQLTKLKRGGLLFIDEGYQVCAYIFFYVSSCM